MATTVRSLMASPFFRFVMSGGVAALVNIGARIALSAVVSYGIAIVIAYLIGMTTAFLLMKLFVFQASGRASHTEYVRFGMVNLIALAQVWLVSMALDHYVLVAMGLEWNRQTVAHTIGVLSPVLTSYFLHKHFSFG